MIDAEARKRGDQTGLDTLVVHALNDEHSMLAIYGQRQSESVKCSTWGVRPQGWNSKELTGARTSGGACGLIRWYARNLTRAWKLVNDPETDQLFGARN
jgi:hypothetical protein